MNKLGVNFRIAFTTFLVLIAATEAGLRLAGPKLQDRWPAGLVSLPLLRDLLEQPPAPGTKTLLVLGDSVFYGSALREHGVADWRDLTPPAFLRRDLAGRGWRVLSLSADGLEGPDLERLLRQGLGARPDAVVVELNYRMLAAEAAAGPKAVSRPWLDGGDPLDGLRRGCALFRYAEWAQARLFEPSLKDWMKGLVGRAFVTDAGNADQNAALLGMKLTPYYGAPVAAPDHEGLRALARLPELAAAGGAKTLFFLTPQNLALVADYLNAEAYRANLSRLRGALGPDYRDWSARRGQGAFYDHCHFDPTGNKELATWIENALNL